MKPNRCALAFAQVAAGLSAKHGAKLEEYSEKAKAEAQVLELAAA